MRLKIQLSFQSPLKLPIQYNHMIQAFLLQNISPQLATFLHSKGYTYENRVFRLFVFSNLFGIYQINKPYIYFNSNVHFWVASPINDFIAQFAESLFKKQLHLNGQPIFVESVEIKKITISNNSIGIKMLSPMTVYSTLSNPEQKKTYYYSPFEKEFSELIEKNLQKKYHAYYPDADKAAATLSIHPDYVNKHHEKVIRYKDTIIKGWLGTYQLEGSLEALRFAALSGLGSKNAQGFGFFEVLNENR